YSKIVADNYKSKHHSFKINFSNFFSLMEEVISMKASPLGVPNEIPLTVMSREMSNHVSIVLSGEGADELLGGYGRIYRTPFEYAKRKQSDSFYKYFINEYDYMPRKIRDQFIEGNNELRKFFDN